MENYQDIVQVAQFIPVYTVYSKMMIMGDGSQAFVDQYNNDTVYNIYFLQTHFETGEN